MIIKATQTECSHCGLPVSAGLVDPQHSEQFCCGGCRAAWQLIHANGLDAFYSMVEPDSELCVGADKTTDKLAFAEFNEVGFAKQFVTVDSDGLAMVTLALAGMHCPACVWLIEKLPSMLPGVAEALVNWNRASVTVRWQADRLPLSQIAQTLDQLGYRPQPAGGQRTNRLRQDENRNQLVRIGIAAAAAGNNMLIAAALYLGMFSWMSEGMETLLRVASCLVGLVSVFGPGRIFLRGALAAVRTWTPHMDLPIALALVVGSTAGLVNTIRGTGEIYFDTLSALICLLLVGRWVQFRQQHRAADAVELLYRLVPRRARRLNGGEVQEVAVDQLQPGDTIQIRPGDLIAADGIIVSGKSTVDESILTGESRPVARIFNDPVSAGTTNLDGVLIAQLTAVGPQTRIHNVIQLVEEASSKRPAIVQWANRIGGYFVIAVTLLAIIALLVWLPAGLDRAIDRAVALLIVACPCALAMATPLTIAVSLGKLAANRILVKDGDVLQQLTKPGIIWLDKTGTLTLGNQQVDQWVGDRSLVPVIAKIESEFNHPVARALIRFAQSDSGTNTTFKDVEPHPIQSQQRAGGVAAAVGERRFLIGNRQLLTEHNIEIDGNWPAEERKILAQGHSPCWIAVDGKVAALVSIGDIMRPEAKQLVKKLANNGWEIGILSGDHQEIVAAAANELETATYCAEVTPEEKLDVINQSHREFPTVVMVGDGVNDSAALAAATVGVAVQGSAEASLAAAPVYLADQGLSGIDRLFAAVESNSRTIGLNFAVSLSYNIVGVGLAISGILSPLVAAILMPLSSITVISLSLSAALHGKQS